MGRPRGFDRDAALRTATLLFWDKGYAATSTDRLIAEMGIARQSFYHAFGDKWTLYLEVMRLYLEHNVAAHIARLEGPSSPSEGIRDLLEGLVARDDELRTLGCLSVGSAEEFGVGQQDLLALQDRSTEVLARSVRARLTEAVARGELPATLEVDSAARSVLMAMDGIQVAARRGADLSVLLDVAAFASGRLLAA